MQNWSWGCTPIILALGRWRQEDQKFMFILGHVASSRLVGLIRPYVGDKKEKSNFGSSKQLMLRAIFEPF